MLGGGSARSRVRRLSSSVLVFLLIILRRTLHGFSTQLENDFPRQAQFVRFKASVVALNARLIFEENITTEIPGTI
jgi:hypothetical protein